MDVPRLGPFDARSSSISQLGRLWSPRALETVRSRQKWILNSNASSSRGRRCPARASLRRRDAEHGATDRGEVRRRERCRAVVLVGDARNATTVAGDVFRAVRVSWVAFRSKLERWKRADVRFGEDGDARERRIGWG